MRLIDANRLKEVFRRNTGYDYADIIDMQPTVDSNSERAELQAYFDGESFGWDEGREALIDELKAEIEKLDEGITSYNHDNPWVYKSEVMQILDNIGKESEDKK